MSDSSSPPIGRVCAVGWIWAVPHFKWDRTYVPQVLCSPGSMFPSPRRGTPIPSPAPGGSLCSPGSMFPTKVRVGVRVVVGGLGLGLGWVRVWVGTWVGLDMGLGLGWVRGWG